MFLITRKRCVLTCCKLMFIHEFMNSFIHLFIYSFIYSWIPGQNGSSFWRMSTVPSWAASPLISWTPTCSGELTFLGLVLGRFFVFILEIRHCGDDGGDGGDDDTDGGDDDDGGGDEYQCLQTLVSKGLLFNWACIHSLPWKCENCIVGFSIGAVVVVKLVNDYNELWWTWPWL